MSVYTQTVNVITSVAFSVLLSVDLPATNSISNDYYC